MKNKISDYFVMAIIIFVLASCSNPKLDVRQIEAYNSVGKIVDFNEILKNGTVFYFLPAESCADCAAEMLTFYNNLPNSNLVIIHNENSESPKNSIQNEYVLMDKYKSSVIEYFSVTQRPYFVNIDKEANILYEGISLLDLL